MNALRKDNWTREQTLIALNYYCKIPFSKVTDKNPLVQECAALIGRSVASVKMKIGNLGSLDPCLKMHGIGGLKNASKLDREIWDEFFANRNDTLFESETLIAKIRHVSVEKSSGIDMEGIPLAGEEREAIVKIRVGQHLFRQTILSSYNNKCCISGVAATELLEACHIVDWSEDRKNRLEPTNGICLNALFHKAYDTHLLSITPDYLIVVSESLLENKPNGYLTGNLFSGCNRKKIILPERFLPDRELLDIHYQKYLHKNQ